MEPEDLEDEEAELLAEAELGAPGATVPVPEVRTQLRHRCLRCGHVWYGKPNPKRCAARAHCGTKYWAVAVGGGRARGRPKSGAGALIHLRVVAREERLLRRQEAWDKRLAKEAARKAERRVLKKLLKKYS